DELDLDAVLARKPDLALVDELAHTNAPGSLHDKRWQDVQALLDAGIDVISTVNIQHIESLNDVVRQITGVVQRETIPDAVLTGGREGATLVRRGARIASRASGGELFAVHVSTSDGLAEANPGILAGQRALVETLGGTYHQVVGEQIPRALVDFARSVDATQ